MTVEKRPRVEPRPLEETVPADLLKHEVRAWAERIGVQPKEIHLRQMTRKWASCSSNGRLTFNADLLKETAPFRAEVIVHELLHLKLSNHGRVFRALLKAYLADCKDPSHRQRLRHSRP